MRTLKFFSCFVVPRGSHCLQNASERTLYEPGAGGASYSPSITFSLSSAICLAGLRNCSQPPPTLSKPSQACEPSLWHQDASTQWWAVWGCFSGTPSARPSALCSSLHSNVHCSKANEFKTHTDFLFSFEGKYLFDKTGGSFFFFLAAHLSQMGKKSIIPWGNEKYLKLTQL